LYAPFDYFFHLIDFIRLEMSPCCSSASRPLGVAVCDARRWNRPVLGRCPALSVQHCERRTAPDPQRNTHTSNHRKTRGTHTPDHRRTASSSTTPTGKIIHQIIAIIIAQEQHESAREHQTHTHTTL